MPRALTQRTGLLHLCDMKKWLFLLQILLQWGIYAQAQQHDRFWITGYSLNGLPPYLSNIIDFGTSPPTVTATVIPIETVGATCAMSDAEGNLLFYTNGGQVRNKNHQMLENGDSLNVSPGEYPLQTYGTLAAYPLTRTLLILPGTHNNDWYHIIHLTHVWCGPALPGICVKPLQHTLVDMSANNEAGKVVHKNKPLIDAWAMEYPAATRHANGRDWWIVVSDYLTASYHTVLFNDAGIIDSFTQLVGYKPDPTIKRDAGGTNVFSPDGSIYVDSDARNGHRIFDFDRCTGLLSNFRWIQLPAQQPFGGAAISPNSRFLYITASVWAMQYDLWEADVAASVDTVAVWDGFCQPCPGSNTTFGECQLGMDGRIYVVPNNSVYYLNYIEQPDLKGQDCAFVQHGLEVPNWFVLATPVHPNYRLGALEGSPCDTLTVSATEAPRPPTGLRIYPNPAQGQAVLELPEEWTREGAVRYRIFDALGVLVAEGFVEQGANSRILSLTGLPDGLYVCQAIRNGQVLGTSRLTVAR